LQPKFIWVNQGKSGVPEMAQMSTVVTEFADNGNSRTFTLAGHTVLKPKLVIQKRRVPSGNQTVATTEVDVILATTDATGLPLKEKVRFSVSVNTPVNGDSLDNDAALAIFRDIVAGDEFAASVVTQNWLK
jgi:hypothetical protein